MHTLHDWGMLPSKICLLPVCLLGALLAEPGRTQVPDGLAKDGDIVEAEVVGIGVQLLRYLSVSGLFISVALAHTGGLQGTGDTRSPLVISIISQIVVPLGLCAYWQTTRGLAPADIWTAILLGHITRCALSVIRFTQGKWRGIVVDIDRTEA